MIKPISTIHLGPALSTKSPSNGPKIAPSIRVMAKAQDIWPADQPKAFLRTGFNTGIPWKRGTAPRAMITAPRHAIIQPWNILRMRRLTSGTLPTATRKTPDPNIIKPMNVIMRGSQLASI